jgi:hypothetical protein
MANKTAATITEAAVAGIRMTTTPYGAPKDAAVLYREHSFVPNHPFGRTEPNEHFAPPMAGVATNGFSGAAVSTYAPHFRIADSVGAKS